MGVWWLLFACAGPGEAPAVEPVAPPAREEPPPVAPAEPALPAWTAGVVEVKREGPVAVLREVRTGRHEGYDRVVFELDALPGYHVEYVDRPVRQCGSGDTVEIAGDGWLQVRLTPAAAHTEAGAATVTERERKLDLGVVRELESTCDFEADVTWVVGVASPGKFRVLELTEPPRVVVDVQTR